MKSFDYKPMNCPGCVQIFNQGLRKLQKFTSQTFKFGRCMNMSPLVQLQQLITVRTFTQDDTHFCTEDQITNKSITVTNLIIEIYKTLGFEKHNFKYSDRRKRSW